MPLSQAQKSIIKASIPFLEENGVQLTAKFYQYMLDTYPEVRPFFNKAHQITKRQPKILAFALVGYAKNIDDLTPLTPFVRQIVEKHVGLQVVPDQYNIVGVSLLKTLKEILGDAATPEFMKAWEVAYFDLANVLIGLEKERYDQELRIDNAWIGFKDAEICKIESENNDIKSIYIKSSDNKYANFYPGQYITIRISTDNNETVQSREYSLSNSINDLDNLNHYRISVKRIDGGLVSNYIHDNLKVGDKIRISAPYGKLLEPFLKGLESKSSIISKPATFFIGGIGITPAVSSIEYFLKRGNPVKLLLSNSSIKERAFGNWLQNLLNKYDESFTVQEYISQLNSTDSLPENSNYQAFNRRLNESDLSFISNDANNYLVGPSGYRKLVSNEFTKKGIELNSEEYGPVEV